MVFEDDILEDEMIMINDEGQLCPVERDRSSGILNTSGGNTNSVVSYHYTQYNGETSQDPRYGPTQTVQCHECYRLRFISNILFFLVLLLI